MAKKRGERMKSVLISIRPQWCEKIVNGEKTIEVRKTAPKGVPFKAFIYATRPKNFYKCGAVSTSDELLWLANGKVEMGDGFKLWADGDEYQCLNGRIIGEFICDKITKYRYTKPWLYNGKRIYHLPIDTINTCLSYEEIEQYLGNKDGYGLHITALKIYDKPRALSEFINALSNRDIRCKHIEKRQTVYGKQYMKCTLQNCICEFRRLGTQTDCIGYKMLNEQKPITRPPQSYMFVEEIETSKEKQ